MYLAATRPDLTYSSHILTQLMQKPQVAHWNDNIHVVRYFKETPGKGIVLLADPTIHITGLSESNWDGCLVTREIFNKMYCSNWHLRNILDN